MQNNQDKLNSLERKCSDLQNDMQTTETKYRESKDMLAKESERNKQLTEILSDKELEINEVKLFFKLFFFCFYFFYSRIKIL